MKKILVIFASLTGNTESIAQIIADYLTDKKYLVEMRSFDFDPVDIDEVSNYDAVLVGTYTWDDGDLPYEVEDFYEELEEVDLTTKVFGVFGSADSFYHTYGGAIELVGDRATDLGAKVIPIRLKIDIEPDKEDVVRCHAFAEMVSLALD